MGKRLAAGAPHAAKSKSLLRSLPLISR
jgi:hypothetical protein